MECARHVLRSRHLRHAARVDEARDLHGSKSSSYETVDELRPDRRGKDVGLVLQTVPRPDVDHRYARMAGHAFTLAPRL